MNNFSDTLLRLDPISLEEMDSVKLMNRTDTKFAFSTQELNSILEKAQSRYRILTINGKRSASYTTLYFDTPDNDLYMDHHRGKPYRFKIRIRNYVDSGLFYLEIKQKIKGRTIKNRIKVQGFEESLSDRSKEFIRKTLGYEPVLQPALWNQFNRITLVSTTAKERVTIDTDLQFSIDRNAVRTSNLAIAEVKQETRDRHSGIIQILREKHIRETGISKYCIGTAMARPEIKHNAFKEKVLFVERINKVA